MTCALGLAHVLGSPPSLLVFTAVMRVAVERGALCSLRLEKGSLGNTCTAAAVITAPVSSSLHLSGQILNATSEVCPHSSTNEEIRAQGHTSAYQRSGPEGASTDFKVVTPAKPQVGIAAVRPLGKPCRHTHWPPAR